MNEYHSKSKQTMSAIMLNDNDSQKKTLFSVRSFVRSFVSSLSPKWFCWLFDKIDDNTQRTAQREWARAREMQNVEREIEKMESH